MDGFLQTLRNAPYKAYFFETPGVSRETAATRWFEFVLVDAPGLRQFAESNPDLDAFASHFPKCLSTAVTGTAR